MSVPPTPGKCSFSSQHFQRGHRTETWNANWGGGAEGEGGGEADPQLRHNLQGTIIPCPAKPHTSDR